MGTRKREKLKKREEFSPEVIAEFFDLIWNITADEREQLIDIMKKRYSHTIERKPISFSWRGSLRKFRKEFTAIELEKKAMDWRTQ